MTGPDEEPAAQELPSEGISAGRKTVIALLLFAVIAALAWRTMESGRMRTLVLVVLGGFALRVLLGRRLPTRVR